MTQGTDGVFKNDNSDVINTLRAVASGANAGDALNPRKIVFISPPDAKDAVTPKSGVTVTGTFYDPWGKDPNTADAGVYHIAVDGDYTNDVTNPYGNNNGAGVDPLRQGVIAWSLGKDGVIGDKKKADGKFSGSDDVISWQ